MHQYKGTAGAMPAASSVQGGPCRLREREPCTQTAARPPEVLSGFHFQGGMYRPPGRGGVSTVEKVPLPLWRER